MDILIDLLIRLITGLFGQGQNQGPLPKGPGFPNLPQQLPPRAPQQPPRPISQRPTAPQRSVPPRPISPPRNAPMRQAVRQAPVVPLPPPRSAPKPAPVTAPPVAPVSTHSSVAVDAAALRRWLRPKVLHDQFMLSEIFQPPLALREPR